MNRRWPERFDYLLSRLVLYAHLAVHSRRLKTIFYALYCLGAIFGAVFRTSFGRPWALMLHSMTVIWVKQLNATVQRIVWALEKGLP